MPMAGSLTVTPNRYSTWDLKELVKRHLRLWGLLTTGYTPEKKTFQMPEASPCVFTIEMGGPAMIFRDGLRQSGMVVNTLLGPTETLQLGCLAVLPHPTSKALGKLQKYSFLQVPHL